MKTFSILILTLFLSGCGSDSGDSKPTISEITSFTVTNSGATDYIFNGVTGNGLDVGTVTFTVPLTAPNTLFYNCSLHSTMTGVITIIN